YSLCRVRHTAPLRAGRRSTLSVAVDGGFIRPFLYRCARVGFVSTLRLRYCAGRRFVSNATERWQLYRVRAACGISEGDGVFVPSFPWGVSRVCGRPVGIFVFGRNG